MGFFSKIFNKSNTNSQEGNVGGMEDFMTLIRVYYQSAMAANLGITNLKFVPDMATFKRTLQIQTVNNKLGIAEKKACQKMMSQMYGINDDFFKEIDNSIKKNCKNMNDIQKYFYIFQGFNQDLMMLMGNLMQWKFRMPGMFKKLLRNMTAKTIHDILNKNDWSDLEVMRTCASIRKSRATLSYSEEWMTEFVYNVVTLAKKEPRKTSED